jgi:threonine/homoserine/homoserine lactone efflux protein
MGDQITMLLGVASIWGIAVVIPGPNFFITAQTGVSRSRAAALCVVAGLALGTALWGLAGFLGIRWVFVTAPWAYLLLKVLGGSYLIFLGVRLLLRSARGGADRTRAEARPLRPVVAFRVGLLTNLTNPKTALFVASLFASVLPANPAANLGFYSVAVMVFVSLAWYGAVALLFSTPRMVAVYGRCCRWVDAAAGGLFVAFGMQLVSGRH